MSFSPARCLFRASLIVLLPLAPARAQPGLPTVAPAGPVAPLSGSARIEAGTGQLLTLPRPAATVIAADPRIARVQPTSPTRLFVMGVAEGRTTVIATAEDGSLVAQYEITVRGTVTPEGGTAAALPSGGAAASVPVNTAALEAALREAVPGGQGLRARVTPSAIVLEGSVASPAEAHRAAVLAAAFGGSGRTVDNELTVRSSTQVNVRVRIAEISRQITRELGLNWQALGSIGSFAFGLRSGPAASTVAAAAVNGASSLGSAAASRIAGGLSTSRLDLNAVIDALAADQLITILAEPNLTAQSGETASFLAGGEFPVPVAASSENNAITIQFKPFGVSLSFVPTVLSVDRMSLRVRPEVSELSQNGAISVPISGGSVQIPALTVRRAETTVELGSGQSFAIAGLLQRNSTQVQQGLAGLADLPVLGPLFRSDLFQRSESELVIIVTPYIVRPVSDPAALATPADRFRPATDLERVLQQRQLSRGAPPLPTLRQPVDAGFMVE
ncbi:type II and III secretion system protein family protein [Teichococcus oryzae]|uniref:Type II and III secretion system protein family protein n=1 Tax=Teichococcus oryzae TaxID=1608942 RepID=A0A5B2TB47_9PROT|nr:type II and III secretion system protein family protein [Pseudoroseomonas oryzae]KAA2211304.1 type II and III secretion system protein family protein [Pseudoroseomonas oryzae]